MEFTFSQDRPEDRLATAVFAAALLHGILILGIRFAAPAADDQLVGIQVNGLPKPQVCDSVRICEFRLLRPDAGLTRPNISRSLTVISIYPIVFSSEKDRVLIDIHGLTKPLIRETIGRK